MYILTRKNRVIAYCAEGYTYVCDTVICNSTGEKFDAATIVYTDKALPADIDSKCYDYIQGEFNRASYEGYGTGSGVSEDVGLMSIDIPSTNGDWITNPNYETEKEQYYIDIPVSGITTESSATIFINGKEDYSCISYAKCIDGSIRLYVTTIPESEISGLISWGAGNGSVSIVGNVSEDVDMDSIVLYATIPASGWSITKTNGWYTNKVTVAGMKSSYDPYLDLIVTSPDTLEEERSAIGLIGEAETFDGYVLFKAATEVPTIDLNVRFLGIVSGLMLPTQYVNTTMEANKWVGKDYSFEEEYPHETFDIEVSVPKTATVEQAEAFGAAIIAGSANDNVVSALGEVPTIDIPILVKVVNKECQ